MQENPASAQLQPRDVRLLDRRFPDPRTKLAAAEEFGRHVKDGDMRYLRRRRTWNGIIQRMMKD